MDDIERLLGKRPYESRELRNIDRFRNGPGAAVKVLPVEKGSSPVEEGAAPGEDDKSGGGGGSVNDEADGEKTADGCGDKKGGEGDGKSGGKGRRPGLVVAT